MEQERLDVKQSASAHEFTESGARRSYFLQHQFFSSSFSFFQIRAFAIAGIKIRPSSHGGKFFPARSPEGCLRWGLIKMGVVVIYEPATTATGMGPSWTPIT